MRRALYRDCYEPFVSNRVDVYQIDSEVYADENYNDTNIVDYKEMVTFTANVYINLSVGFNPAIAYMKSVLICSQSIKLCAPIISEV